MGQHAGLVGYRGEAILANNLTRGGSYGVGFCAEYRQCELAVFLNEAGVDPVVEAFHEAVTWDFYCGD